VLDRPTYLRHLWPDGAPTKLRAGADPAAFHVGARRDGDIVATGIAYDRDGGCVTGNVSTIDVSGTRSAFSRVLAPDMMLSRRPPQRRERADLQPLQRMARPGLEPGTPRFSAADPRRLNPDVLQA
jgi:hypothetical protein